MQCMTWPWFTTCLRCNILVYQSLIRSLSLSLPPGSSAEGPVGRADQKARGASCLWVQDCRGPLTFPRREAKTSTPCPPKYMKPFAWDGFVQKIMKRYSLHFARLLHHMAPPSNLYIFQNRLLILPSNLAMIKRGVRPLWPAEAPRHRDIKVGVSRRPSYQLSQDALTSHLCFSIALRCIALPEEDEPFHIKLAYQCSV